MAVSDFQKKLKSLLESDVICESDFVTYVSLLYDLAKLLEHENGFPIYAKTVKHWIGGFGTIFSKTKTKNFATKFWETYGSKFCTNVTMTMFTLLQCFRQFDPNYTQEFYLHWKAIVSRMDGLKRADTFYSLADKFKIVVQHLRTAASRTEQLAVMSVLRIYIECVPVTQLFRLHEHDNADIIKLVAGFMENPSILNQNEFLYRINAMGHCIESLKPKKIICRKLNIDMDDANHSMWLDFNKTEQTVSFATVSLADCGNQTFATTHRVKLRQSVKDSHLLEINGFWNVISVNTSQSSGQRVTVRVYFVDKTEELISTAVKTVFRFVNFGDVTGSASQGFISDYTEVEAAQDESKVSPEAAARLNDSFTSVIPPELIPLGQTGRKLSLPTQAKSRHELQRWNSSLPLFPHTRHENDEADAELPFKSNLTYVIKNSVKSVGDGTPTNHSPSSDPNATYVLRESVNPIADEQPEYDHDSHTDSSDELIMEIERPSMELDTHNQSLTSNHTYTICKGASPKLDNESLVSNHTYTICNGAPSGTLVEENRLADHGMVFDEDDVYDGLGNENAQDDSQYGDAYANKKIVIIENIMIVPPKAQPHSLEPIQNFSDAPRQNVEYFHCSQVDVSVSRKEVFDQYSQPTTSRERLNVKETSFRSRHMGHIETNESVQCPPQSPIVAAPVKIETFDNGDGREDQLDPSVKSDRKESFVPFTPIIKQNKCNDDDCTLNASDGETHRCQAVSPFPIELSGQYESFSPIATSTQRSQVRLRKVSSQLPPDPISPQTGPHNADSSFQKSIYQNSVTLTGLPQENSESLTIADLPKMSQIGPVTESRKELKSSQEAKATQSFTSSQNSTKKPAPASLQQRIEVSIVDPLVESSQTDLNASGKRTKSPSSQILSVSAPQRDQNSEKLGATEVTEASPQHSSQKQTATSSQQSIQIVPAIDPNDDVESTQKAKRPKLSQAAPASKPSQIPIATRNTTQMPVLQLDPQSFDNDFNVDLPEDVDCFQPTPDVLQIQAKMSEPRTETPAAKISPRAPISSENPKASIAIQLKKTAAGKVAKSSTHNKAKSTSLTRKLLNANMLKKMSTAIDTQPPKRQSKVASRYSSLTKRTTLNSQFNSKNLQTIRFDEADVTDLDLDNEAAENSSNDKTLENDCVNTDGIRVDENGTVYDDNGCVFANNEELQRAAQFYIANDGLNFLKKENVKSLPARKREKYERRLRTIQRMIDRGLERLRVGQRKITDIDPYAVTIAETTIQGEKRKRRFKEVSVTTSKKTYVDNATQVTYSKRTSKLHYVFDEGTSTDSKSTTSKAMSKSKVFNKAKTAQTVKTPHPSSVNLTEGNVKSRQNGIPSNRPDADPSSNRLEFDQTPMVSMDEDCAEANVSPIPASSKMDASQHKLHNDISLTSPVKTSLPIYNQQLVATIPTCQPLQHRDESPSTNIDCTENATTNGTAITDDKLCSTPVCAGNMKELLDHLNGIEMESDHTCRGSCEQNQNALKTFIDRLSRKEFHQDQGASDWAQLYNCLLESLESMFNTASDRLQMQQTLKDDEVFVDRMIALKSLRSEILERKTFILTLKEQIKRASQIQLGLEATLNEMEEQLQQQFEKISAMRKQMLPKNLEIGLVRLVEANNTTDTSETETLHARQRQQCDERSEEEIQDISSDDERQHELLDGFRLPSEHAMQLEHSPLNEQVRINRKRKSGVGESNVSGSDTLSIEVHQCNPRNDSKESDVRSALENHQMEEVLLHLGTENPVDPVDNSEPKKRQFYLATKSKKTSLKHNPNGRKQLTTYPCPECGKRISSKSNLVKHLRFHTGEKPYKCGACDLAFSDPSNLKRHQITHSDERPFVCDICKRSFRDKRILSAHECSQRYKAEQTFRKRSQLSIHREVSCYPLRKGYPI